MARVRVRKVRREGRSITEADPTVYQRHPDGSATLVVAAVAKVKAGIGALG